MNKYEYFIKGLLNQLYLKKEWRLGCFVDVDTEVSEDYYLKLVKTETGYGYKEKDGSTISLVSTKGSLLSYNEPITVPAGTWSNQPKEVTVSMGSLLFNIACIHHNLKDAVPFIGDSKGISLRSIDSIVSSKLVKNPTPYKEVPGKVTVKQWLSYVSFVQSFEVLGPLVVTAATPTNVTPPDGLDKFLVELNEKYKGKLEDPIEAAKYEQELKDFDTKYLKGDQSLGVLLSGKTKNVARLKMYMSAGSEAGFDAGEFSEYINKPLYSNAILKKSSHASSMTAVRAGSYNRGVSTQVGGTASKNITRALGYVTIDDGDCNTTRTLSTFIDPKTTKKYIGRNYISNGKIISIDVDNVKELVGKSVDMRSPAYCERKRNKVCRVCAGERLYLYKSGAQVGGSAIANVLIYYSFKRMKDSALKITEADPIASIS